MSWSTDFLINKCGLRRLDGEPCIYFHKSDKGYVIIALYVDDFIIAYTDHAFYQKFKHLLSTEYVVKDLGPLERALNMEISRTTTGGVFVNQRRYVLDCLERFKEHLQRGSEFRCFNFTNRYTI